MKTACCLTGAFAAWVLVSGTTLRPACATVMDYHDFVQGYADALVQYDFDGSSDAQRREDKKGSNDLVQKTTPTYNLDGFDSSSKAVRGGFFTTSAIGLPSTVSFEAIVRLEDTSSYSYFVGAYDGSQRSYFGVQIGATNGDGFFVVAGSAFAKATIVDPYAPDHWYFYAVTMSYNSGNDETTINTYVADLTDGATSLTHTASDATVDGTFLTTWGHGIGTLNNQGTSRAPFVGTIDEISFYSGVKDAAFFQANLNRILRVPEPSSVCLLGLAAVAGIAILGRRRPR